MGRLIEFYVPETYKPKVRQAESLPPGRVIELVPRKSEEHTQVAWTLPDFDSDLA